jgi:hypothetical protein
MQTMKLQIKKNRIRQQESLKRETTKKSFISIDTSSPLSTNLQLAQWPIVIFRGGDETTLAKSLVMAVKGPAQHWYSSLK